MRKRDPEISWVCVQTTRVAFQCWRSAPLAPLALDASSATRTANACQLLRCLRNDSCNRRASRCHQLKEELYQLCSPPCSWLVSSRTAGAEVGRTAVWGCAAPRNLVAVICTRLPQCFYMLMMDGWCRVVRHSTLWVHLVNLNNSAAYLRYWPPQCYLA